MPKYEESNMTIEHGHNDPFVRAAREATVAGQTETVYAVRVEYKNGDVDYWNVSPTPHSEEDVIDTRNHIYRSYKERPVESVEQVSRRVTITADDWIMVA